MTRLHRLLCIALLIFGLTAVACGDDDNSTTSTTISQTPTSAVGQPGVTTASAQGVTDGAVCPTLNARGATSAGKAMVCTTVAGNNESRWRPA